MPAVSTMILRSLRLIGEKEVGDTLSTAEQTDYLNDLNSMMDSWSIDRSMVYQVLQESFSLTASDGTYTIGSGGDFNTTRPTKIVDPCFIRDASNYDSPVRLLDSEAFGRIVAKGTDGSYPIYMFYDQAWTAGLGQINLYPEPTASLTLFINSWKKLQSFANVSTALSLPPGYQRAIEFNFAIEVAGGFTSVSPEVAKIARESKALVKSVNTPAVHSTLDPGIVPVYSSNILNGP